MPDCSCQEIRVGDIGTHLELELQEECVVVDISSASVKNITLQRPDKTSVTRAGTFTTDGTDGKIYLATIAGDLSMEGTYYIQAYIELPAWQGYSSVGEFEVHDNLG